MTLILPLHHPPKRAQPAWRAPALLICWGVMATTLAVCSSTSWAQSMGPAAAPSVVPSAGRPGPTAAGIAWRSVQSEAELNQAVAEARQRDVPLLLFWGASWCPPCNRLKATLFKQADFIALTRQLVPVLLDGDAPGAQQLGSRFGVRGYPTLVLLAPDGREITRIPGEVQSSQVLAAIQTALASSRSVASLWAAARAEQPLTRNEWRMLAWYPWELAAARDLPEAQRPTVLADLAIAAARSKTAEAEAVRRLQWKAVVGGNAQQGLAPDASLQQLMERWLQSADDVRRHADLLLYSGDDWVRRVAPNVGAERQRWTIWLDRRLRDLQRDPQLAPVDQLAALSTRVELARLDERGTRQPQHVPASLIAELSAKADGLDKAVKDPHERQAVIPAAAYGLTRAGLWREADALLERNLTRVPEPYALMSQLASQARSQGRDSEALRWSSSAFERSRGPATRLQWGAAYLNLLVELSPQDAASIETTARLLLTEAARDPGAFHERSGRSLQRVTRTLSQWAQASSPGADLASRQAVLATLRPARDALCAVQVAGSAERSQCEAWWPPAGWGGPGGAVTGSASNSAAPGAGR